LVIVDLMLVICRRNLAGHNKKSQDATSDTPEIR
jgi:hypothetical protein